MTRKAVSGIMLTLLFIGMLTLAFNIQPVKASGTIYIRADGNIDPPDAPISTVDNVTYIFAGNINDSIVVERDNIVVDGTGYTLQGNGSGIGFNVTYVNNVTIQNTNIDGFEKGVYLHASLESKIIFNNVTRNTEGIRTYSSQGGTISWNSIKNNILDGIAHQSQWCEISWNNITGNGFRGIRSGADCTFRNNRIMGNDYGVALYQGDSRNLFLGNIIVNNSLCGVKLFRSCNNTFYENNVETNDFGASLEESYGNTFFHNNFINNTQQTYFLLPGYANMWYADYPSSGNHWSDYGGTDLFLGPFQNETGSDGVGDDPYIIDENNVDHYPLMEPWLPPDIAVLNATASKNVVGKGYSLNVTVFAQNQGNKIENLNMTLYANETIIDFQTFLVRSGDFLIYRFTWDTAELAYGNYTIWAYVDSIQGETYTSDNTFIYGTVTVTIPGDVDGDFDVDIIDVVLITNKYASIIGHPPYASNSDINDDGVINILDVVICTSHYGQKWP